VLQPFRPLLLSWSLAGELGTLTGAEQVASPPPLAGDPLFCALYVNELLTRFLQRFDPHPDLFEDYGAMLGGLAAGRSPQPVLRVFEYRMLNAAGFGMQLEHEADSGREIRADAWYRYLPESGPVRCEPDSPGAGELVSGAALLALKSGEPGAEHLQELKALMRMLIRHYLGDKPIKLAAVVQLVSCWQQAYPSIEEARHGSTPGSEHRPRGDRATGARHHLSVRRRSGRAGREARAPTRSPCTCAKTAGTSRTRMSWRFARTRAHASIWRWPSPPKCWISRCSTGRRMSAWFPKSVRN
jgi:DNA repair protein RecO (recombination protein O)